MSTTAARSPVYGDYARAVIASSGRARQRERDRAARVLRWHRAVIALAVSVAAVALFVGPVYFGGGWLFDTVLLLSIFAGPVMFAFAAGAAWEEARSRTREEVRR